LFYNLATTRIRNILDNIIHLLYVFKTKSFNLLINMQTICESKKEREKRCFRDNWFFFCIILIFNSHFVYWQGHTVNHIKMIKVHFFVLHEYILYFHLHCYFHHCLNLYQNQDNEIEMMVHLLNSKMKWNYFIYKKKTSKIQTP